MMHVFQTSEIETEMTEILTSCDRRISFKCVTFITLAVNSFQLSNQDFKSRHFLIALSHFLFMGFFHMMIIFVLFFAAVLLKLVLIPHVLKEGLIETVGSEMQQDLWHYFGLLPRAKK